MQAWSKVPSRKPRIRLLSPASQPPCPLAGLPVCPAPGESEPSGLEPGTQACIPATQADSSWLGRGSPGFESSWLSYLWISLQVLCQSRPWAKLECPPPTASAALPLIASSPGGQAVVPERDWRGSKDVHPWREALGPCRLLAPLEPQFPSRLPSAAYSSLRGLDVPSSRKPCLVSCPAIIIDWAKYHVKLFIWFTEGKKAH